MAKNRRKNRQRQANQRANRQKRQAAKVSNSGTTIPLSQIESWGDLMSGLSGRMITPDSAMKHSAVYACVRIIAGIISTLPVKIYERSPEGYDREDREHPVNILLQQRPNPRMTATMFYRTLGQSMLMRGNGLAWIERLGSGVPIALWPIRWESVSQRLVGNRIIYEFTLDDGSRKAAWQDDVLHFPGSMEWNGLCAKSPIQAYAGSVGIGMDANEYAQKFFENDATPGGYISYPEGVTPEQVQLVQDYWAKKHGGENRHSIGVLGNDGKFYQTSLNAEDAQLLETREFQIVDIARVFGVPPHMIGAMDKNSNWGTGKEQDNRGFVTYSADPHFVAIEQEIDAKLLDRHLGSNRLCRFDRKALVRGDIKTRSESNTRALGGSSGQGHLTVNEVRRDEGREPIEGGDKIVMWTMKGNDQTDEKQTETDDSGSEQETNQLPTSVPTIPEHRGADGRGQTSVTKSAPAHSSV